MAGILAAVVQSKKRHGHLKTLIYKLMKYYRRNVQNDH